MDIINISKFEDAKRILEIDKEVFGDEALDVEQGMKIFNKLQNNIFAIKDNNKIVAYISLLPIKQNLFNKIKNNNFTDKDDLDENSIDLNSNLFYIGSLVVLKEYQSQGLSIELINHTMKKIKEVDNSQAISWAFSDVGYYLLNKYNFKEIHKNTFLFLN